jgi:lincosamide nucleotidyltransferase A/C/D/E
MAAGEWMPLLGEETRPHSDLDLALDHDELERARQVVAERGFEPDKTIEPGLPARLVMRDGRGREVDFHPLIFDHSGDGWQQLSESGRAWGRYPAKDLGATGVIAGRPVRCLASSASLSSSGTRGASRRVRWSESTGRGFFQRRSATS